MEPVSQPLENMRLASEANNTYYQIPADAEIKVLPMSSLSLDVQQKIQHLEVTKPPTVICMSPVTRQAFPPGCKPKTLNEVVSTLSSTVQQNHLSPSRPNTRSTREDVDSETCFVPVRTSKKTASTILKLFKLSDDKFSAGNVETILPRLNGFNSKVIGIKVSALCMSKNRMYVLPNHRAKASTAETGTLSVRSLEATISHPNTIEDTIIDIGSDDSWLETEEQSPYSDTSVPQDDLDNMTGDINSLSTQQHQSSSSSGSSVWFIGGQKLQDEVRCEIQDRRTGTVTNSAPSSPETNLQSPVRKLLIKRKLSLTEEGESLKKKNKHYSETTSPYMSLCSPSTSYAHPLAEPPQSPSEGHSSPDVVSSLHSDEASSPPASPHHYYYSLGSVQGHIVTSRDQSPAGSPLHNELPQFSQVDDITKAEKVKLLEERLKRYNDIVEEVRKKNKVK